MVLSKIDSSIDFPELQNIHPYDLNKEVDLYKTTIKDVDIIFGLGNLQDSFIDKNISIYPIYLIQPNKKAIQIGLYEIETDNLTNYIDKNKQFDLEKYHESPLIYKYVTNTFLNNQSLKSILEHDHEDDDDHDQYDDSNEDRKKGYKNEEDQQDLSQQVKDIPEIRKDIFVATQGIKIISNLREESKKDASLLNDKFDLKDAKFWINKFMKNNKYYEVDNEGGGDCFFATIRDAFSQIGQQTTIKKLREKLSNEATEAVYQGYKEQFDMFKQSLVKDTEHIKLLENEYNKYKNLFANSHERNEKLQLMDASKKVKDKIDNLLKEKKVSNQLLHEFAFMKDINSLDKFQAKIKTCEFWGETWAISTIERILNIKFILLSEESYNEDDLNNVLNCGQLNDSILESRGEFLPEFYLILSYTGSHYKLIGYKGKQIFDFKELPFDIKKMVVNRCMEKNAGIFSLIPDFKKFKDQITGGMKTEKPKFEELSQSKIRGLYDDNIIFNFYDKSIGKPLPGKGVGEKISKENLTDFSELASIKDWRKKLSKQWLHDFPLDGLKWASVEHYYQASKFKEGNPEFYKNFSLDSGTELSKNALMAKAAGSKNGKWEGTIIRQKGVTIDPDFYADHKKKVLYDAEFAKFSQNPDLKQLLLSTKNAKLLSYQKGREPELNENLMFIREKLQPSIQV
jgi:predicted NAD-dependent protein-ADP-ribosyltransferase YbiA (DUF1768 family)